MSGFAGIFSIHPLDRRQTGELLKSMGRDIRYEEESLVESWSDDHLGVVRVQHGVVNPEVQPIFNEDGSLCIVMDGEVFDYDRERRWLERRGHVFRFKDNDAEYCLHLYEECGEDAFAKLHGSFALLLYKMRKTELILANDRFASHMPCFFQNGAQTAFGTQLRSVLRFSSLRRTLDLQAVFEFFTACRVLPGHTYYRDVYSLPPATVVRFQDGGVDRGHYWTATYGGEARPESYHVDALAEALARAVDRKTRGRHRLGLLLSGVLDSRTVAARSSRPLVSFTMADFENREVRIARRVAMARGYEHVFLRPGFDHYPDLVSEAVAICDGVRRCDHAHVLGFLPDIRARCDVLLDALIFDSALKGSHLLYNRRSFLGRMYHTPVPADVPGLDRLEVWRRTRHFADSTEGIGLFNAGLAGSPAEAGILALNEEASRAGAEDARNVIDYATAGALSSKGSHVMSLAVRAHMVHRLAIADNDLWSVTLSIPPELRAKGRVLRKALKRISPELAAIPNANMGLRADLPVGLEWFLAGSCIGLQDIGVWPRPKTPHPAYTERAWPDMGELIRHHEKLGNLIVTTLHDPACIDPGLFRIEAADLAFRRHLAGKADYTNLLFTLLTFGRWHRDTGPLSS